MNVYDTVVQKELQVQPIALAILMHCKFHKFRAKRIFVDVILASIFLLNILDETPLKC